MEAAQWITRLAAELQVDDVPLDDAAITDLLDLTREVAHGVERLAGPLSAYLVGVAVGRGAKVDVATESARALLVESTPSQQQDQDASPSSSGRRLGDTP